MLADTQSAYVVEKRYQRKDGQTVWCSVVTTLLRDLAAGPKYFITVVSDITEHRVLQDQILRAQRMESIGRLAGGIAHDLNNLLAPILMGVELLKLRTADESLHRLIDTIGHSAARGKDLVRQVLTLGEGMEAGRVPVQVRSLVRGLQEVVTSTFPKNIELEYRVPADCWLIAGDATQLGQVLLNLCMNARDAMPNGGTITVRAENAAIDALFAGTHRDIAPGDYLMIEVKDTGVGMSAELKNRIFEPHFTTKADAKTSGLGRPVSQGIVHAHGGCMEVRSEPGKGTTLRIYLPAVASAQPAKGDSAHPFGDMPRGLGELILVVDDEVSILQITRQTLEAFGYRVLTAEDGAQAIATFAAHRDEVALVLTDMMMPVMDGAALIAALRRLQPGISIVAVSGINAAMGAKQLSELKVGDFIAEPFTAPRLLDVVQRVLAGNKIRAAT